MCCSSFLKMMMFIFNGCIFLAGTAILGVGVWVKVDSGSLLGLLDKVEGAPPELSQLVYVSYLLIGVGAVLLIIGFLGCCGAVRESRCMLLTFFSIVLIIFLAEVAGAVVLLVFEGLAEDLLESLDDEVKASIRKDYGESESLTSLWNSTMEGFKCCGYKNYTDFDDSPFYNNNGKDLYPITCCNATFIDTVGGGKCSTKAAMYSEIDGCFNKLLKLIEDNAVIIAAVALGIAALEIAAMVVSMVLYKQIGNKA